MSALIALILVPTAFALFAGFSSGLGDMMLAGVKELAPTGVMLLFAILYFGVMIDAGLFEPLVTRLVQLVHGDPVKITMGTAFLALCVSLDGDGTTTYMITVAAMLPLYRHMKMDVRMMACLVMMAGSVMNVLPWGGPTARAATALKVAPGDLFVPMIPAMAVTACWVLFVAWIFGRRERRRLIASTGLAGSNTENYEQMFVPEPNGDDKIRRPRLLWFNLALTVLLMVLLIVGVLPLGILFMLGFAIRDAGQLPDLGATEGPARRARWQRAGSRQLDICGWNFCWDLVRHQNGGRDGSLGDWDDPSLVRTLHGPDNRDIERTIHLSDLQRCVLLRHAACSGRDRFPLWSNTAPDCARIPRGPASSFAQPTGSINLSAGWLGGDRNG